MVEQAFPNAFAAFGLVPEKEGRRTIVEHRGTMINVDEEEQDVMPKLSELANENVNEKLVNIVKPAKAGYSRELPRVLEKDEGLWSVIMGGNVHIPSMKVINWHWSERKFAIAIDEGSAVGVFDTNSGNWVILKDERVRNVRCLSWRPCANDTLAVGCGDGIAIWTGGKCTSVWNSDNHGNVVSLSWSCDGAKLASASITDYSVRLWDGATGNECRVCAGGVVKFSKITPDLLFVGALRRPGFRFWSVDSWDVERWGFLDGPPNCAAWCGNYIAVAAGEEQVFHILTVGSPKTEVIHCEHTALPRLGPGGIPRAIAWDPSGKRIAVCFFNDDWARDDKRRNVVAVYAVSNSPFAINPVGFVSGHSDSGKPVDVAFANRYGGGALLATAWSDGSVTFAQLLFQ